MSGYSVSKAYQRAMYLWLIIMVMLRDNQVHADDTLTGELANSTLLLTDLENLSSALIAVDELIPDTKSATLPQDIPNLYEQAVTALETQRFDLMLQIVKENPEIANHVDVHGNTALILSLNAARAVRDEVSELTECIYLLIELGADVAHRNNQEYDALSLAVFNDHDFADNFILTLLDKGALATEHYPEQLFSPTSVSNNPMSLLELCIRKTVTMETPDFIRRIDLLLLHGADPDYVSTANEDGWPLAYRVMVNEFDPRLQYEIVSRLINAGCAINKAVAYDYSSKQRYSLLWLAIEHQQPQLVKLLLEKNAELVMSVDDSYKTTPLHFAVLAHKPNIEVIKVILNANENINQLDSYGSTALSVLLYQIEKHYNAKYNDYLEPDVIQKNRELLQIADVMLHHGADPHIKSLNGISAISLLEEMTKRSEFAGIVTDDFKHMDKAFQSLADVYYRTVKDKLIDTPDMPYVISHEAESKTISLSFESDQQQVDEIVKALDNNNYEKMFQLLSMNARDYEYYDAENNNLLMLLIKKMADRQTASYHQLACFNFLLRVTNDINHKNKHGENVLLIAFLNTGSQRQDIIRPILNMGATPNVKYSVNRISSDLVLNHKVSLVNVATMEAVSGFSEDSIAVLELLLRSGADINSKLNDKQDALRPLQMVILHQGDDAVKLKVVDLLLKYGARQDIFTFSDKTQTYVDTLGLAIEQNNEALVDLLLSYDNKLITQTTMTDGEIVTQFSAPHHAVAFSNNIKIIQKLVNLILDHEPKDANGNTILNIIPYRIKPSIDEEVIRFNRLLLDICLDLLSAGADPDHPDSIDVTPRELLNKIIHNPYYTKHKIKIEKVLQTTQTNAINEALSEYVSWQMILAGGSMMVAGILLLRYKKKLNHQKNQPQSPAHLIKKQQKAELVQDEKKTKMLKPKKPKPQPKSTALKAPVFVESKPLLEMLRSLSLNLIEIDIENLQSDSMSVKQKQEELKPYLKDKAIRTEVIQKHSEIRAVIYTSDTNRLHQEYEEIKSAIEHFSQQYHKLETIFASADKVEDKHKTTLELLEKHVLSTEQSMLQCQSSYTVLEEKVKDTIGWINHYIDLARNKANKEKREAVQAIAKVEPKQAAPEPKNAAKKLPKARAKVPAKQPAPIKKAAPKQNQNPPQQPMPAKKSPPRPREDRVVLSTAAMVKMGVMKAPPRPSTIKTQTFDLVIIGDIMNRYISGEYPFANDYAQTLAKYALMTNMLRLFEISKSWKINQAADIRRLRNNIMHCNQEISFEDLIELVNFLVPNSERQNCDSLYGLLKQLHDKNLGYLNEKMLNKFDSLFGQIKQTAIYQYQLPAKHFNQPLRDVESNIDIIKTALIDFKHLPIKEGVLANSLSPDIIDCASMIITTIGEAMQQISLADDSDFNERINTDGQLRAFLALCKDTRTTVGHAQDPQQNRPGIFFTRDLVDLNQIMRYWERRDQLSLTFSGLFVREFLPSAMFVDNDSTGFSPY